MTAVWSTTIAHDIDGFAHAVSQTPGPDTLELPTLRMVELGRSTSAGQLLAALDAAGYMKRQMGSFFEDYDVLLTPTLGAPPARLGTYEPEAELEPRELFDSWSQLESFLPVFNATGQPAVSLPLHQGGTGLPIGMQLVGRFGDKGDAAAPRRPARAGAALGRARAAVARRVPLRDSLLGLRVDEAGLHGRELVVGEHPALVEASQPLQAFQVVERRRRRTRVGG